MKASACRLAAAASAAAAAAAERGTMWCLGTNEGAETS